MAKNLSELNFEEDLKEVLASEDAQRWRIKDDKLSVLVEISSTKTPEEVFHVYFGWTNYPDDPPSMKFWDPKAESFSAPTAWPLVRGFRPGNLDACVNWTAEGFVAHPEWRNDPEKKWNSSGNALIRVLRILQEEMDKEFNGRFKG